MQTLSIRNLIGNTIRAVGALDFDKRQDGVSPRRLPPWTRPQLPQLMDVMVRMPSGVRLTFQTNATRLGISFLATNMVTPPAERRPIRMNLETKKKLWSAESNAGNTIVLDPTKPGEFEMNRGDADTLWFEDLPSGYKGCELWLPHNALIELRSLLIEDDATIAEPHQDFRPKWVHYGSSISHCMEADEPAMTWPAVAARYAGVTLHNLGFGGQCHLDQFVARTIRDSSADAVSIKVGINVVNGDTMRERVFEPALHGFLDTVREGAASVPLILISPIYCPSAEDAPGPTVPDGNGKYVTIPGHAEIRNGCMSLTAVRKIIARVVEKRRAAGDQYLHYVDGRSLFGAEDAGDLPDDLHPNPAGYIRMGERFGPLLDHFVDV